MRPRTSCDAQVGAKARLFVCYAVPFVVVFFTLGANVKCEMAVFFAHLFLLDNRPPVPLRSLRFARSLNLEHGGR